MRSPRSTRVTFAAWLDAQGLADAGAALVPRLLLPRRLRRRRGAGLGLGRPALLRQPARLPRARRRRAATSASGVLTWPEGNAWLAERLAAPLGERLHARPRRAARRRRPRTTSRSTPGTPRRSAARALDRAARRRSRCRSSSRRALLETPPPALREPRRARCAMRRGWSPTCSSTPPLDDRPGAPPSWDNVLYGSAAPRLRRRDAPEHAAVRRRRRCSPPTGRSAARRRPSSPSSAAACSSDDWRPWAARVVADLAAAHPDLPRKVAPHRPDALRPCDEHSRRRACAAARRLRRSPRRRRRVHFAHADLSAYSVFEEALFHGMRAGRRRGRARSARRRAADTMLRLQPRRAARSARHEKPYGPGSGARLSTAMLFLILLVAPHDRARARSSGRSTAPSSGAPCWRCCSSRSTASSPRACATGAASPRW